MRKPKRMGLLPRILIAIAAGTLLGFHLPEFCIRLFATFNVLFGEFLQFLIPLIIAGLVTPAIADIGKGAKRLLLITVSLAYIATLFSGFFAYFVGDWLFPSFIHPNDAALLQQDNSGVSPLFSISIPPLMGVMTSLVLAFTLGLGIAYCESPSLRKASMEFRLLIAKTIEAVIIPYLPLYIFGIFLSMAYAGAVLPVLRLFAQIILIIFLLHIAVLLLQFSIAGWVVRRNPLSLLFNMLPAYFTALGTQSSAATIPITLKQCRKNGVSEEVSGFVVPLCATIHLSGSTLKIVACALALMLLLNMPYDFPLFAGFICMLGIAMVAAPGVPGGAIMASLGLLASMLGFDENAQALMIALYIAMDSFGTACNVTGDGAIALMVDKWSGCKK